MIHWAQPLLIGLPRTQNLNAPAVMEIPVTCPLLLEAGAGPRRLCPVLFELCPYLQEAKCMISSPLLGCAGRIH